MKALALFLSTIVFCAACVGMPGGPSVGTEEPFVGAPMASPANFDRADLSELLSDSGRS